LYGCETWSLNFREGNEVPTKLFGRNKDEASEKFIILHNEELCDLYRPANIVRQWNQWS